ncbi:MAG TPA: hypothetical protein VK539_29540 [Myxococcaceae bacterium]|nr:hypothetical protein [Myxococcaceae bacterium]
MPALARPWLMLLTVVGLGACRHAAVHAPTPAKQPAKQPTALRYNVTYEREPEHALEVEVVLVDGAPRDFLFTRPGGVSTVRAYRDNGEVTELTVEPDGIEAPKGTRFLRYRYPMDSRPRRRGMDFFTGGSQGDARLIAGRTWLIRPRVATGDRRVELSIQGVDALLPWQPEPSGLYQLRDSDLVDSGFHGFGGRRCEVALSDVVLRVGILGELKHMNDEQLCDWLRRTAEEVRMVRSPFPHPRVTVLVSPVQGSRAANVFGMVLWSAPPSIALLVGQDAPPSAFQEDWVAIHEMLHLTHPTFVPRTRWISEGLATYYTEVARARSGRFTPEQAWHELLQGFETGKSQADGRTFQEMINEDAPPGIYWVGAFFALRLDVELRRATGNQRGLEHVLELLATQGSTTTLKAYSAAVDQVAGRPLFDALLAQELRVPAFAGLGALLEALGVKATSGGVTLERARDSVLREALEGLRVPGAR